MGRGGYRWNAGRPAHKAKTGQVRALDVRQMKREGVLREGRQGTWAWWIADTGERTASIGYSVADGAVCLDFSINGEPVAQRVPLTYTSCNLGGERAWFRCPCCGARMAVLYLRWKRFACRRCNKVAYRSQSEDACGRAWLKQSKAEAKLGPNWSKPKGMRRATRDRLLACIFECERQRDDALVAYVSRLMDLL